MKRGLVILMMVLCLVNTWSIGTIQAEEVEKETVKINLHAQSSILMDRTTGRILYGSGEQEIRAMASTTKIMTTIIALENGNLDDMVQVSSKAAAQPKVKLYIKKGEEYRLEDLLYALMLQSSNDVAVAIAEHIGGSVEEFCKMMTDKATELGAFSTQYITPNGLDAKGHQSTAYDLALISRYALENETFRKIINTPAWQISSTKGNARDISLSNKNNFLSGYNGAYGIKTGFTSQAGYCFVGAAKRGDMDLISVVLGSGWYPYRNWKWLDTTKLMNHGFKNYKMTTVLEKNLAYKPVKLVKGMKEEVPTFIDGELMLPLSELDDIRVEYKMNKSIEAPVFRDSLVGMATVYLNEEVYESYYIRAADTIERQDILFNMNVIIDKWIQNPALQVW